MTGAAAPVTWVLGSGGLLGRAVVRAAGSRGWPVLPTGRIPWGDPDRVDEAMARGVQAMLAAAGDGPWRVAWCAGSGVTGSTTAQLGREVEAFGALLSALSGVAASGDGGVFVSSSAGGVYAGSIGAPFTEHHAPAPISAYGKAKMAGERLAGDFHRRTGVPVVIGRIANLYGPGQNLAKPQGLISALCRSQLTRQPVSIYVPMDTLRDYLYVHDGAAMVLDALAGCGGRGLVTKIVASGQAVTVGALLGEVRRVFRRRPLVVLGASSTARYQAVDLRLRSVLWPELDQRAFTTLPAGLAATARALQTRMQRAS